MRGAASAARFMDFSRHFRVADATPLSQPLPALRGEEDVPILILSRLARTMEINARVISGLDPGAIPGGSTKTFPGIAGMLWGRSASTDV